MLLQLVCLAVPGVLLLRACERGPPQLAVGVLEGRMRRATFAGIQGQRWRAALWRLR
jgi:hypothetical protein